MCNCCSIKSSVKERGGHLQSEISLIASFVTDEKRGSLFPPSESAATLRHNVPYGGRLTEDFGGIIL